MRIDPGGSHAQSAQGHISNFQKIPVDYHVPYYIKFL